MDGLDLPAQGSQGIQSSTSGMEFNHSEEPSTTIQENSDIIGGNPNNTSQMNALLNIRDNQFNILL